MNENNDTTLIFLKGLLRYSGAYADTNDGEENLRAYLSVLKAFIELGRNPESGKSAGFNITSAGVNYIRSCHHSNGGFSSKPGSEPTAYDTAVGLICLRTLGDSPVNPAGLLYGYLPDSLNYLQQNVVTQFDHFMLVAAYEECGIQSPVPGKTIKFFVQQLQYSLQSKNVLDTAIAAASLIRSGNQIPDYQGVVDVLLSGQNTMEGGFGEEGTSSLFVTYCVLRTLVLLKVLPNIQRLSAYLDTLKTGVGYTDLIGGKTSAGATYMNISMRTWIRQLQAVPVKAAMTGDVDYLSRWLANGGNPNQYDDQGWTVLLAAASRGRSEVVNLLLNHQIPGAIHSNPTIRYLPADALPIYLAGQSGDLPTVRLLLKADPGQLHAISSVNGHTILLQAAFYGKEKHLELAKFLLDQASADPAELNKLLSATNVRGYNALGMQDLWHNQKMKDLLLKYYPEDLQSERGLLMEKSRLEYYQRLLLKISPPASLTEKLINAIAQFLNSEDSDPANQLIDELLHLPGLDINRLGSDLQMPPLIFAITGVDTGNPSRAEKRYSLAKKLLLAGADPSVQEKHPMAVGAVIRASVLNNFEILKLISEYMTAQDFTRELNISPGVNGLTAMHDAIHRALTSPANELASHIAQITWMIQHGARLDLPDNVGQTQYELANAAVLDGTFPVENSRAVLEAVNDAILQKTH